MSSVKCWGEEVREGEKVKGEGVRRLEKGYNPLLSAGVRRLEKGYNPLLSAGGRRLEKGKRNQ